MKKTYTAVFIITIMLLSMFLVSCSGTVSQGEPTASAGSLPDAPAQTQADVPEKAEETDKITYSDNKNAVYYTSVGERYETYDTQEALTEVSDNIVTGECISSESFFREHGFKYTVSEVLVGETYKGDIEPGSTIKVVEFGGTFTAEEFIEASGIKEKDFYDETAVSDGDATVVCGVDGFFPMNKGENVLLFLAAPGSYDGIENVYGVMGSSDGKLYKISDSKYARPNPENVEGGYSSSYSMQSAIDNSHLVIDVGDLK